MMDAARQKWLRCGIICFLLLIAGTSCRRSPMDPTIHEAIQALNNGDQPRAEAIFADYLAKHPDSVEALRARGGMYAALGEPERALEDLNRAIELAPEDGVARNNRALALTDLNLTEQAIADYEKAIECGFDNADLRNELALLYSKTDRKKKAIHHYGEAIRHDPMDVVFYLNRGACLVDLEEYDQGITDFTSAIELAPNDFRPYALRYNAYVEKGELDKARPDAEKAHQLNPGWKARAVEEDNSIPL